MTTIDTTTMDTLIRDSRIQLEEHPEQTYDILLELYLKAQIDALVFLERRCNETKD